MNAPRSILVVAAHPDDEILGVGGTMARHAAEGAQVRVLIVAEGATSRHASRNEGLAGEERTALQAAAATAAAIVGSQPPLFLGLPDNRLDGLELLDIVKPIEAVVAEAAPELVYTHHVGDLNIDHRIVHRAVLTACRPQPGSPVRGIYCFETVSSTEWAGAATFSPTRFVDITPFMDRKMEAVEAYGSEMRAFPHARSRDAVRALAQWRGATVGHPLCEAFEVLREIVI